MVSVANTRKMGAELPSANVEVWDKLLPCLLQTLKSGLCVNATTYITNIEEKLTEDT
jgi:hypothetical protein